MINNYCFRALGSGVQLETNFDNVLQSNIFLASGLSFLCFGFTCLFCLFSSDVCDLRVEPPQRARTRLDEILENLTSPRLQERPPTGERKEPPQSQEKEQQERTSFGKGVRAPWLSA